jgi:hypothetical protein
MEPKHSGLGIASFILSITSGIFLFLLFVVAGMMEASTRGGMSEDSPAAMLIRLFMFGFMFLALIALGLGIGGLFQSNRLKIFAVLGIVFSACIFFGNGLLIA